MDLLCPHVPPFKYYLLRKNFTANRTLLAGSLCVNIWVQLTSLYQYTTVPCITQIEWERLDPRPIHAIDLELP